MKGLALPGKKIGGHSLIITVLISLVLAFLCASLIMIGYASRFWKAATGKEETLRRNLTSATNIVLADTLPVLAARIDSVDLFGRREDSVIIQRESWGLFTIAHVVARVPGKTASRLFLYGAAPGKYFDGCLYVAEHQRPVSLNGDTRLRGKAYLPKAGLRPAYINQQGYKYDRLLNGSSENSGSMPVPDGGVIHYLQAMVAAARDSGFIRGHEGATTRDTIWQSFKDSAGIFTRRGKWVMEQVSWKGHLLLCSDSMIEVGPSAVVDNSILVAPVIVFDEGFSGAVQAVATDSIVVKKGAVLRYPSALVLLKEKKNTGWGIVHLEKEARLEGILLSYADTTDKVKNRVVLDGNTVVRGIVYASGYAELRGEVQGMVLTDYFIYRSPAVFYENYLVDVEINREKLSRYFTGSPVFGGGKNNLMVWLQ